MANLTISDLGVQSELERNESFRFKDLNLNQYEEFASGDVKDFWAIRESILNTFLTPKGSRYRDLEFGSELNTFLFEKLTDTVVDLIGDEVERLLETIPEIFVGLIELDVVGNNTVNILIEYTAVSLSNETHQLQLGLDVGSNSITVEPENFSVYRNNA